MSLPKSYFLNQMKITRYDLKIKNNPQFWIILDKSIDLDDSFFADVKLSLNLENQTFHIIRISKFAEADVATNSFLWFVNCQLALNLKYLFESHAQFITENFEELKKLSALKKSFWQTIESWIRIQ